MKVNDMVSAGLLEETASGDTGTHLTKSVKWCEFQVDMILNKAALEKGDYLPSTIYSTDGKTLWRFSKDVPRHLKCFGFLVLVSDELVVALATWTTLMEVVPIRFLPQRAIIAVAEGDLTVNRFTYGSMSGIKMLKLKQAVAAELGVAEIELSSAERTLLNHLRKQVEAEASKRAEVEKARLAEERRVRMEAEESRKAAERQRRAAEHAAKVSAILSRPNVEGFTAQGEHRRGVPVVNKEWEVLPDGKAVVEVASYDEEGPGEVLEFFYVKKSPGGRVSKDKPTPITNHNPMRESSTTATEMVVEVDGNLEIIRVFRDLDAIESLRESGKLSGGVLCGVTSGADKVTVYRVSKKKTNPVGEFKTELITA